MFLDFCWAVLQELILSWFDLADLEESEWRDQSCWWQFRVANYMGLPFFVFAWSKESRSTAIFTDYVGKLTDSVV